MNLDLRVWLNRDPPGRLVGPTARDVLDTARAAFNADADDVEFDDALTRLGYRPMPTPTGAYVLLLPEARR